MTLLIDFTPIEEADLTAAVRRAGLEPATFAKKLVMDHLPGWESQDPTLALFDRWDQEDAEMTPEEAEQERRLWEQFEANVNETRRALGIKP